MRGLKASAFVVGALVATVASAQNQARFTECQAKLQKAHQLDMFVNVRKVGNGAAVMVGPTWYRVPFDAKEGFADVMNCVLVLGREGYCTTFDFADNLSGKVVATYKNCRLKPG